MHQGILSRGCANESVTPCLLSAFQLIQWAMHRDEVYREWCKDRQAIGERARPSFSMHHDMIDEQIVTRTGQSGERSVESGEHPRKEGTPCERPSLLVTVWEHILEGIKGHLQVGLVQRAS